jgi:hypothetical protein
MRNEYIFELPNKPLNSDLFRIENNGCELYATEEGIAINGEDLTKVQAKQMLDAHNPTPPAEPTIEEKLSLVGLNINDLKAALGL